MHIKQLLPAILLMVLFFGSCKDSLTGEKNENQPPTTKLTVESINRGDDFRLSSQIKISWFGTDPDGYVVGYEYAVNDTSEGAWSFTTKTDSTFILPITPGQNQDDVLFKVRAIDNDGLKDPVGARLVYPIINSKPTVSINPTQSPPDTLYSIASFGWSFDDPDGLLNIEKTEVAVNDTINGWVEIPFTENDEGELFISLEVDNSSEGEKDAQVFIGRSYSTLQHNGQDVIIPGVKVGERNTFYVRAIDAAQEISDLDSLSWVVKKQQSNTLFLHDYAGSNAESTLKLHKEALQANGIEPDIWIINDGEVVQDRVALSEAFPTVIDPTLKKTLAKWDHIYWISNDLDRNIIYAQDILSEFYQNGGTSFVNIPIKRKGLGEDLFNYLPVDSIGIGNFILNRNSVVAPEAPITAELTLNRSLTDAMPLKGISGSTVLYNGDYLRRLPIGGNSPYNGYKGVAIENPEGNLVYFAIDMRFLDGSDNIDEMIRDLVVGRLGFKN